VTIERLVDAAPRACAQCPWRLANQGTRHPHGFYSQTNLRRLWTGLRTGEAPGMTCHPTDPRMAEFDGYEKTAAARETRECAGAIILVLRELMRFQAICLEDTDNTALRVYRQQAPKGLKPAAIADLVWRFLGASAGLARAIRTDSVSLNDPDVGYPPLGEWDPDVLVRSQEFRT
jgi:hypothetical protein